MLAPPPEPPPLWPIVAALGVEAREADREEAGEEEEVVERCEGVADEDWPPKENEWPPTAEPGVCEAAAARTAARAAEADEEDDEATPAGAVAPGRGGAGRDGGGTALLLVLPAP